MKKNNLVLDNLSFLPRRCSCLLPEDQQRKRNSACFWCWSEWQRGDPVITQDMSYEGAIPEWMGGWQGASPTSPHQGLGHPLCHQPPPPKLTKWPNISPQHHQVTKHISKWPKSPHHRHRSFFPTIRICPTPTPKLGPDHTIKNNAKKINGNTLTNFATAIFVWNENIEYFIHWLFWPAL